MKKWFKRLFKGLLIASFDTALTLGIAAGRDAINGSDDLNSREKAAATEGLEVAVNRLREEVLEELGA